VYLSYQGDLVDLETGDLLVLDHPIINEYYKAALKERIFENLYYAGEEVKQKLDYAKQQHDHFKIKALGIVNMPNFQDLYTTWVLNRKQQYNRYYNYWHTNVFHQNFHLVPEVR
ncbi:MAG: hypothetical protein WCG87_13315, partial [Bacteroidota bacterium]